jgi:Putative ER transporter, 6TM, N-terminal/Fusaric acid resistance protein-like/Aromatic acid exporter family member 2
MAAYESNGWSQKYTTLGYLTAVMSLLSMSIMPRAKFLQSMLFSVIGTCLGAAIALLQIQCAVSARQNSTSSKSSKATHSGSSGSQESVEYNSSASVVAAVFLFATIYGSNALRAKRPQLMLPAIQYGIFTMVASIYAPQFPDMTVGMSFVKRLLETFLTGFGIATGVSLFIFPVTSRTVAGKQIGGLLALMKATIGAHGRYLHAISTTRHDSLGDLSQRGTAEQTAQADGKAKEKEQISASQFSSEAKTMQKLLSQIGGLFGKIELELKFAKREVAYGKLKPEDFSHIFTLLRNILLPILGMTTFIDIMQSIKEKKTEIRAMINNNETIEAVRHLEAEEWNEVVSMSCDDFAKMERAMVAGLTHVAIVFEFVKKPKPPAKDVEKAETTPSPGDPKFSAYLDEAIKSFHAHRQNVVRRWCDKKGVELPTTFWDDTSQHYSMKQQPEISETTRQKMNQHQLYLLLYLEYLIWSMGNAILKMVQYADSKVEDGTMKKKRLIIPAWRRWKEFMEHAFKKVDSDYMMYDGENAGASIWMGDSLKQKKDPEHLPPATFMQKSTNYIRVIPRFLSSPESSYGFRTAVATISIAILAYIRQTYVFFLEERVIWAMIMVAISMSAHTGQGIFGYILRIIGTTIAMVGSLVVWYVADQKTGAILPLFYLYVMLGIWFLVKYPQLAVVGVISMVTGVLIIGYELQVRKIGILLATSNGQPYYKIYILAPYRLAAVIAGLTVNFIWSYFPYPVTSHSTLRKDLGSTLYLLANFYSCIHTTVDLRLHLGASSDPANEKAPMTRLDKARHKVFSKCVIMLNRIREHSNFSRFEPTFGGKFPKATYDDLIQSMQHAFHYMALIAYSSATFATDPNAEESGWLSDFRRFTGDLNITSHDITSTLCLASASIINSQPLPPYLRVPRPYALADRMESIDPELLSVRHVAEPCYAAFAVLEIASSLLTEELAHIVKNVRDLVGEVDFSFHVISTNLDQGSTSSTLLDERDLNKGKQD